MSNPDSFETLVSLAYGELRVMARSLMRNQRPGHTLQTTALVHEAYLRLNRGATDFESRAHFFGAAARAMRQVLIGHARAHNATKRAGAVRRVTFGDLAVQAEDPDLDLFCVDEALSALEALDSRLCRIIELRYFAGLTLEEIAELTGTSVATVKRDWSYARAWLFDFLSRTTIGRNP
jgi:RNA polymerase sigma factor (TIGR02999 family)